MAQLVNRRAARLEVLYHLGRHLLRKGVHPLRANPMVPSKDQRLCKVDMWHSLFQPAQRSGWLGQRILTVTRGVLGCDVSLWQVACQRPEVGQGSQGKSHMRHAKGLFRFE